MDFTTKYMGLKLRSPLVVAASPVSENLDNIKKCEDAGAGALVMYSLFEEQIILEQKEQFYHSANTSFVSAEAMSYFPEVDEYRSSGENYLNLIRKAKESVKMPIIGSLNGTSIGGWLNYAKQMQEAGADAIELNVYYIPTDVNTPGEVVEKNYVEILRAIKSGLNIPVAVKLSPSFSNIAYMAKRLDDAGADALVLFNRFYQPDIDLENLTVIPQANLSHAGSSRLGMRWIAILRDKLKTDLAATGGVHSSDDALKLLMAGANVVMLGATLLKNGIDQIKTVEKDMLNWLTAKEYESITQMIGSMSQAKIVDPSAFERANYMKALSAYKF